MGQRFGHDFSRVRVHSGAAAEQSARDVNAHAYTVGHNIVFGAGRFAPGTHEGRRLIAHELTHVVQQSGADWVRVAQGNDNRGLSPLSPIPLGAANRPLIPMIQRTATWIEKQPTEDLNLASRILQDPGGHVAVTEDRLKFDPPTLATNQAANGGFDATVDTVPTITNSADMHVLAKPQWIETTTQAELGKRYPNHAERCNTPTLSTFRALGRPDDPAIYDAVKLHETHHAADIQTAFNDTFKPWEANLTAAQAAGTKYNGPTEKDARDALYAAMGGTPEKIEAVYVVKRDELQDAYHGSPAGLPLKLSYLKLGKTFEGLLDCGTTFVEVKEDRATVKQKKLEKKLEKKLQKQSGP